MTASCVAVALSDYKSMLAALYLLFMFQIIGTAIIVKMLVTREEYKDRNLKIIDGGKK